MRIPSKILKPIVACSSVLLLSACAVNPTPISAKERAARIQHDWAEMFKGQEVIKHPLSIYEAMARAVKYNLDVRVKDAESAFAKADAKHAKFNMLPSLVTSAGYTTRNNDYSVLSPSTPGTVSTTEDRSQKHADLQFAWNVLDFGVSYMESKQKSDLFLVSQERQRKLLQQVVRDTRYAYWRAWSAQNVLKEIRPFIAEIRGAIKQSRTATEQQLVSPTESSKYRADLWDTFREMNDLEYDLERAQPELLAMINASPQGHAIRLIKPKMRANPLPKGLSIKNTKNLELTALNDRPELREEDYRQRISLTEIKKARLRMLPGIELTTGAHYDSNSYLVNSSWVDAGAKLTWDVLRIFAKYQAVKVAKRQNDVADIRRMALSMAVITQVMVAKLRYTQAERGVFITRNLVRARYDYFKHIKNQETAKLADRLAVIRAKAKWILSELRYYLAYAEWQNAGGQLLDTIGYDPLHRVTTTDESIRALAKQIKVSLENAPIVYVAKAHVDARHHRETRNNMGKNKKLASNKKAAPTKTQKRAEVKEVNKEIALIQSQETKAANLFGSGLDKQLAAIKSNKKRG